ncbi:FBD-associated F-box protein At4g10400-like [Papaver somniferum]|uniref:FBD-associated F-box protein At4g10400-like n=1 Tax=Papaver somniferum TaxID=3469 RepID=UPI000E6F4DDC|nr:FBD-associated F-box protein At4g10400-like [Papaver somniferum]
MGKRKKLSSKKFEEKVDRIGRLPDNLIHHILSFIDVKYAVQASVLSKRWKDVWVSLPFLSKLTFEIGGDGNPENYEKRADRFINFVDMVMIFRDDSDIQTFNLNWHDFAFKDTVIRNVTKWMLMAVKRNVQKLRVEIGDYYDLAFELPHRLLNCKSLRKLEVISASVVEHRKIILPKSMCLPQLEALALVKLSISGVELESLISSCPFLEHLHIFKCDIEADNQQNLVIDSPSLQTFALTNTLRSFRLEDCIVHNITKLSAPNL